MPPSYFKPKQRPSEAALTAARVAKAAKVAAKRAGPDTFGLPELFVVKARDHAFTWELRRFGGVVLQRGAEVFSDQALARADGESALAELRASPDLPTFKRQERSDKAAQGQAHMKSCP